MNKKITLSVQNYFSNLNRIKFSSAGHNLLKEQHMQFQENLDNYFKNFDINSISESVSGTLLGEIVAGSHADLVGENIYSVQYNLYLTSLITHFESFFRDLFVELVNYEFSDCSMVLNFSKKFTFEEIDLYKQEKITKGEIIAQNYKFQNLDSVRKAYELIGLDFFKLLNLEKGRIEKISSILNKRHSIVHGGKSFPVSDFKEIDELSTFFYKLGVDVVTGWLFELDKK